MTEILDEDDDYERDSEDIDQFINDTFKDFNLDDPMDFDALD